MKRIAGALVLCAVALAGCGSSSSGGQPTLTRSGGPAKPSVSPSVSLPSLDTGSPTASDTGGGGGGAPTPADVPGYTYGDAPAAITSQFEAVAQQQSQVFTGVTVKSVSKDGTPIGDVVVLSVADQWIGNQAFEGAILNGMISGMSAKGTKTSKATYGGQQVGIGETATGGTVVAWYRQGKVVLVLGLTGASDAERFAKAYIAAG